MAKLIWTTTGDEIDILPVDYKVYEYFVENLNQTQQNCYKTELDLEQPIAELNNYLTTVNNLFKTKFNIGLLDIDNIDLLNQTHLNSLHQRWVELHLQYPEIENLSEKISPGTKIQLYKINKLIHRLEESFNLINFETPDPNVNFHNPFGPTILNFDSANIRIDYNNLGRSTYNKWQNFDEQFTGVDLNDFKELYTSITVTLTKPTSSTAPKEYTDWAICHNIQPHGSRLNLAIFDKLEENLLKYRKLFYKNSRITSNYFILKE